MRRSFWHGRLTGKDFFKEVYREYNHDNVSDTAAILAYYFVYLLFPFRSSSPRWRPISPMFRSSMETLLARGHALLPGPAMHIIEKNVRALVGHPRPHLLTVGLAGTLYSASRGVDAVRRALNLAYDVKESRRFWETELLAFGMTIGGAALVLFGIGGAGRRRRPRTVGGREAAHRARVRVHLELAPLAGDGAAHHVLRGRWLLPAPRRRAGVQVHYARLGGGDAGLVARGPGGSAEYAGHFGSYNAPSDRLAASSC